MSKTRNSGIEVTSRNNEDIESLIKRFKKKVNNSGILKEVKNASFFIKPSQKIKRKRKEAAIKREKEESKIKRSYKNEKHQSNK